MTYRRAFKVGDRVQIGDVIGEVIETRLQATHLRTLKNEEVTIPNSQLLNGQVVNYSSLATRQGLILHTVVGIGYETPWRQVEAMLLLAAERTPGLLARAAPLRVAPIAWRFCDQLRTQRLLRRRPADVARSTPRLHRNILDVFNEYGVQIMTPAYEGDPKVPKVVPKGEWFTLPAQPDGPDAKPP